MGLVRSARPVLAAAIVAQLVAGVIVAAKRPPASDGLRILAHGSGDERVADEPGFATTTVPEEGAPTSTTSARPSVPGAPVAPDADVPTTDPSGASPVEPSPSHQVLGPPSPEAQAAADRMSVRPRTDRPFYVEDQPVVVAVEVCNVGSEPSTFVLYEGQEVWVTAVGPDGVGVSDGMGGADQQPAVEHTWQPGQCRTYEPFTWWHDHGPMGPEKQHGFRQARAGTYRIHAVFRADSPNPQHQPTHPRDQVKGRSEPFDLVGVTVDVATDRPQYREGEAVEATVHVCNPSSRAHTQTFAWRPEAEIRIESKGYTLSSNTVEGPTEPYGVVFAAGQCRDYHLRWDQLAESDQDWDGTKAGARVPPGPHQVEVLWWGHSSPNVRADARPGVIPDRANFELI